MFTPIDEVLHIGDGLHMEIIKRIKISMLTSNGSGSLIACQFPFNSHNLQGNAMINVVNMAPPITKSMTSRKVDLRITPNTQCI
jgi:hypothetical protein